MDEVERHCLTDKELKKLSRFMKRGNPMRLAADALIARNYLVLDQPELYLSILDSPIGPRFNQRLIAAEALKFATLTPEQSERLEVILRAIISYKHLHPLADFFARGLNIVWKYALVYSFIFISIVVGVPITRGPEFDTLSSFIMVMMSLLALVCMFAVPIRSISTDVSRYKRLRRVCATALGRWGGPASIETLIGMTEENEFWDPARQALKHVLKRLTADDYGKVSSRATTLLSEAFGKQAFFLEHHNWVPLLLDSLEKVGTGAGVTGVEDFIENTGKREWREHAARVLLVLQARQRLERDSARLLRPTANTGRPDELLRAVSSSDSAEEENLLRAVNTEL